LDLPGNRSVDRTPGKIRDAFIMIVSAVARKIECKALCLAPIASLDMVGLRGEALTAAEELDLDGEDRWRGWSGRQRYCLGAQQIVRRGAGDDWRERAYEKPGSVARLLGSVAFLLASGAQAPGGNLLDPARSFVEVCVLIRNERGKSDRACPSELPQTLEGCVQDRGELFG
jgi:hypothetical protein